MRYLHEDPVASVIGSEPKDKASPMFVSPELANMLAPHGDWGRYEEFELRTCLRAPFEGPESADNLLNANNCATQNIFVVRRFYGPDGPIDPPQPPPPDQYSTSYNLNRTVSPLSYSNSDAGISLTSWMEMGTALVGDTASTTTYSTYYGHSMSLAATKGAAWFEAGSTATGTLFSKAFTLAHVHMTLIDYTGATDKIYARLTLFGSDVIPASTSYNWADGTITLSDVFELIEDVTGEEYSSEFELEYDIVGKSVDTDCGSVTAAITGKLTLGIDPDETSITKASIAARTNPCANYASTTVDGICYYKGYSGTPKTWPQYKTTCASTGGYPAPVRSAADLTAIRTAIGNANDWAWLGVARDSSSSAWYNDSASALGIGSTVFTRWAPNNPGSVIRSKIDHQNNMQGAALNNNTGMVGICAYEEDTATVGGTSLTLVITPHIEASVESEISWSWSGAVDMGINLTLSLLDFSIPFTTDVDVEYKTTGGFLLTLTQTIEATLSTLSGELSFWIEWKVCDKILGVRICVDEGKHSKTVAEWDGITLGSWYLLSPTSVTLSLP